MRSFAVAVEETAKSLELGFKNKEPCKLQITSSTVILMLESSVPISWPFNCIRRYKCHPGSFLLEVGRKASTGEGTFCFFTQEGQEIFEVLGKTVANRMNSKQEPKSDSTNLFATVLSNSSENQGYPLPSGISGVQNPFLDFTGGASAGVSGGDGVRFVMKRRTSSPPPPTPNEDPKSPPIESEAGSYSHLRLKNEKSSAGDESTDYDQLARAKECSRFNRTRLSESSKPSSSNSKALKVLGLLRSSSSENVQTPDSSSSETCDLYSHLEFEKRNLKKSQSASNIVDNESSTWLFSNQKSSELSQHQPSDLYNQLNSDIKKKISDSQRENAYDVLGDASYTDDVTTPADDSYDKLVARNVPGTHRHARPEPIMITDDNYNAINFTRERGDDGFSSKQSRPQVNAYEISAPLQRAFSEKFPHVSEDNSKIPENKPSVVKPAPPTSTKPIVHKKPAPIKPPRHAVLGTPLSNGDNLAESGKDVGLSRARLGGNDVRENLISQLKKNFEINDHGITRSPSSPLGTPHSAKKLVEPFYAVSPFGSGSKPTQVVPSEYDVPSNNALKVERSVPESKQQIDFLYAVSPFHSGSHKEVSNVDQNLYDTPSIQNRQPVVSDALNTYDTPSQRPVARALENLYDTPSQQHMPRIQQEGNTQDRFPASERNVQFTYAVSPFAGAQSNAKEIRFHDNARFETRNEPHEPTYCEVPEVMGGYRSIDGYDPVGGILQSGKPTNEPLYANPRD